MFGFINQTNVYVALGFCGELVMKGTLFTLTPSPRSPPAPRKGPAMNLSSKDHPVLRTGSALSPEPPSTCPMLLLGGRERQDTAAAGGRASLSGWMGYRGERSWQRDTSYPWRHAVLMA